MTNPFHNDGELPEQLTEEINSGKPKKKPKPGFWQLTVQIPLSAIIILLLIAGGFLAGGLIVPNLMPSPTFTLSPTFTALPTQITAPTARATSTPRPTSTPALSSVPSCAGLPFPESGYMVIEVHLNQHQQILRVNLDGTSVCNLFNVQTAFTHIAISKDGQLIAVREDDQDALQQEIGIFNYDGTSLSKMQLPVDFIHSFSWSPDATALVAIAGAEKVLDIYVLTLEDKQVRRVTRRETQMGMPVWSPDGKKIALRLERIPNEFEMAILDVESGSMIFSDLNFDAVYPHWSEDGEFIVYIDADRFGISPFAISQDGKSQSKLVLPTQSLDRGGKYQLVSNLDLDRQYVRHNFSAESSASSQVLCSIQIYLSGKLLACPNVIYPNFDNQIYSYDVWVPQDK